MKFESIYNSAHETEIEKFVDRKVVILSRRPWPEPSTWFTPSKGFAVEPLDCLWPPAVAPFTNMV